MLNGIRKLMTVDALSERVAQLEKENEALRAEASRRLMQTSFSTFKHPLHIADGLRDYIYERTAHQLEGVLEDHLLACAKEACKMSKRSRGYLGDSPIYADGAMADMCDLQVQVELPPVTTSFRVAGVFR